ncbi:MAG: hypothetical protein PHT07_20515 [Paludibacter sp.]|nr:hypothetical protein [Paludibacter sp.]
MEENVFESIMPLKVEDLVSLIVEKKQVDFDIALQYLYESKLYDALSIEETKLWHLSTEKLLDMLITEKNTGELVYPDYV